MQTSGSRRRLLTLRNAIYLTAGVALHLALLALMLWWRPPPPASVAQVTQVGLVEGAGGPVAAPIAASPAPAAPSTPVPVPVPVPVPATSPPPTIVPTPPSDMAPPALEEPTPLPPSPAAPMPTTAANAAAAISAGSAVTGGGCAIASQLKLALQADDAIRTAISDIPAAARSVANAVMLWDGRWTPTGSLGSSGPTIRAVVAAAIGRSPPACRSERVRGPSLVIVGDPRRPVTLAFGSGIWRWGDLLDETATKAPPAQP